MNTKVLIFSNSLWNIFNFRLNLILRLKQSNYYIKLLAPFDNYYNQLSDYDFVHIKIDNHGLNPIVDFFLFLQLVFILIKEKPDCILTYTPKCNIYAGLAARLTNTPIINNISGLGSVFINNNLTTQLVMLLYKFALNKSLKVFFQNNDDLSLFIQKGLVNPNITGLLPGSGVDINRFTPIPLPSPRSSFVFLLVARMLKDKGILEFVTAARALKAKYPHIECQLLGFLDVKNPTAVSSEEMSAWVNEGVVNYLGTSDSVVDYLRLADCVVLPSYREGTPRSLLEAASVGKPIITTDAVGCREVVDEGYNGFLCEPRNAEDLTAKMERMLLLPEADRLKMGVNSREKAVRQFDEKIVIDKYVEVIRGLG